MYAVLALLLPSCWAFLDVTVIPSGAFYRQSFRERIQNVGLNLVPLARYADELSFFSESESYRCCIDSQGYFDDGEEVYELGLVEEQDLPDLCRFVVSTFGADAIRLSQDMNSFERLLMSPAAELLNGYSSLVAFAEVFSGTKQRLKGRLDSMNIARPMLDGLTRQEMIDKVEKDSLILVLAKRGTDEEKIDIVGSIELRLQVRWMHFEYRC